ncbi:hypothetical protein [Rhodococcus sp. IEGM 1406]|uniref:hypothetical protein n=1 Tax=Rhodococcus sp. IEGM 1406 TaxID=3047083 RepID=UPI0024B685BC|nr:hypothetical protein [Rhodococcus sp. IEGM 1406]MDI9907989.1 hypothetical protein [Rhodococcus sp. IEGM 1406]
MRRSLHPRKKSRTSEAQPENGRILKRSRTINLLSTKFLLIVLAAVCVMLGGTQVALASQMEGTAIAAVDYSPAQYRDQARETQTLTSAASKYLTFSRWNTVSEIPTADMSLSDLSFGLVESNARGGLSEMLLSVGMFLVVGLGFLLTMVTTAELMGRLVYWAEEISYTVGFDFLGITGEPSDYLIWVGLAAVTAGLWSFGSKWRYGGGDFWDVLKPVLTAGVVIGVMTLVFSQATKNHIDNTSTSKAPIAGMANDGVTANGINGTGAGIPDGASSDPSAWAVASPGWIITKTGWIFSLIGGAASSVLLMGTDSITSGASYENDTCHRYVESLHAIYENSAASSGDLTKGRILTSFDNLVGLLHFDNYKLAALGDSSSADATWCRFAESQAKISVGDQIFVSRVAGLYGELIGTGGMGIFDGTNDVVDPGGEGSLGAVKHSSAGQRDGLLVTADGEWVGDEQADRDRREMVARSLFGPIFQTKGDKKTKVIDTAQMALTYFAVCIWPTPGGNAEINPDWRDVYIGSYTQFKQEKTFGTDTGKCGFESVTSDGEVTTPSEPITHDPLGSNYPTSNNFNFAAYKGVAVGPQLDLFGVVEFGARFGEGSGGVQFSNAPAAGAFYDKVSGGDPNRSAQWFAVMGLIVIMVLAWILLPILVGALLSQLVAVGIVLLAPLYLLLLLVPTDFGARATKNTGILLLKTQGVQAGIQVFFALMFLTVSATVSGARALQVTDTIGRTIVDGIAGLLGIVLLGVILKVTIGLNIFNPMTNMTAGATALEAGPKIRKYLPNYPASPLDDSMNRMKGWFTKGRNGPDQTGIATGDVKGQSDVVTSDDENLNPGKRFAAVDKRAPAGKEFEKAIGDGAKASIDLAKGKRNKLETARDKVNASEQRGSNAAAEILRYGPTEALLSKAQREEQEAKDSMQDTLVEELVGKPDLSGTARREAGFPETNLSDNQSEVAKMAGVSEAVGGSQLRPDGIDSAVQEVQRGIDADSVTPISAPLERDGAIVNQLNIDQISSAVAEAGEIAAQGISDSVETAFDPRNLNISELFRDIDFGSESQVISSAARELSGATSRFGDGVDNMNAVAESLAQSSDSFLTGVGEFGRATYDSTSDMRDLNAESARVLEAGAEGVRDAGAQASNLVAAQSEISMEAALQIIDQSRGLR